MGFAEASSEKPDIKGFQSMWAKYLLWSLTTCTWGKETFVPFIQGDLWYPRYLIWHPLVVQELRLGCLSCVSNRNLLSRLKSYKHCSLSLLRKVPQPTNHFGHSCTFSDPLYPLEMVIRSQYSRWSLTIDWNNGIDCFILNSFLNDFKNEIGLHPIIAHKVDICIMKDL